MIVPNDDVILSHQIDEIRLALAPYCCGPGEAFSLEPIRDHGTYTHDNTYLWLDMTWERLRGRCQRDSLRLIHALCLETLSGPQVNRIVLMTGQSPSLSFMQSIAKASKLSGGSECSPPTHLKSPPIIDFMEKRLADKLPLLPKHYAFHDQEDLVPVTRQLKNGTDIVCGWRKPDGPLVVSFDPIITSDPTHNRKRRIQRKNGLNTVRGAMTKLARTGGHTGNTPGTRRGKNQDSGKSSGVSQDRVA